MGHTGTLDPFATGLLPVCIGKATRIAGKISGNHKEYFVSLQLGLKTDSGDITGKTIASESIEPYRFEQITALKKKILSICKQKPPRFSALKVGGKRAYELARKNQEIDLPERPVRILDFEILKYSHPQIEYRAVVSKGTYLRSLSETIAEMLGTIGTTTALRRSQIAGLEFAEPVELEKITSDNWRHFLIPVPRLFPELPHFQTDRIEDFLHGRRFAVEQEDAAEILVFDRQGNFGGFGQIKDGKLQPVMVLG